MGIKFVKTTKIHDYNLTNITIDLSRKTGVLMRQSRRKADENNYESRLRQESLVSVAIELRRDTDDSNIEVYDEGAGISGTKGYDERPKLSKLYMDIANDVLGSIVVARADRLFRDKHFRNVSMFTELAEKKKIILIVPGRTVYDFTKTKDLQAFQKDMQEAYSYISTQIAYMQETRMQKVKRGLYGGGHLPAPYVVDKHAWKDEQAPIIYGPWQEIAIGLLKRFVEYDFSLARLAAYIESLPCIFPYPPAEDLQKYHFPTYMTQVEKGYTFVSLDALKGYLSNLTLGGYAKIGKDEQGNELLLEGAFDPAVPMDLLELCYAAIKGHYPDGTPFGKWKDSRRPRKHTKEWESSAILHGFLDSDDGAASFSREDGKETYECNSGTQLPGSKSSNRVGIMRTRKMWTIPCHDLDQIVLTRLCNLAQHDPAMAERVKAIWDSRKTDDVDESKVLKTQIEKAEAQIKRLDGLLTNPARPLSQETEGRYIGQLSETEAALQRLLKKQAILNDTQEDPEKVIPNFYYVLSHLPDAYKNLTNEEQKKMMRKVAKMVKLNILSPHVFLLHIEWENGIALRPDIALIWRGMAPNNGDDWSPEEDDAMRRLYASSPQIELMKVLPKRGWCRVLDRAQVLKLKRDRYATGIFRGPHPVRLYHRTMSYEDLEAVARLVEGEEEKERVHQVTNELAKNTLRGGLSAHWWLPLDSVGYADAASGVEPAMLNVSGLPYELHHPA